MMNGYGMSGILGGGFGFGWVFMVLFGLLIVVGAVALVKWMGTSSDAGVSSGNNDGKALDILKERYARGEINEQEFQKKKHELAQ